MSSAPFSQPPASFSGHVWIQPSRNGDAPFAGFDALRSELGNDALDQHAQAAELTHWAATKCAEDEDNCDEEAPTKGARRPRFLRLVFCANLDAHG